MEDRRLSEVIVSTCLIYKQIKNKIIFYGKYRKKMRGIAVKVLQFLKRVLNVTSVIVGSIALLVVIFGGFPHYEFVRCRDGFLCKRQTTYLWGSKTETEVVNIVKYADMEGLLVSSCYHVIRSKGVLQRK